MRVKDLSPHAVGMAWFLFLVIVGCSSVFEYSAEGADFCTNLNFSDSQHRQERQIVHQLLKQDIEKAESLPGTRKVDIEIAVTDLNDDGTGEVLAHIHHPFFCGLHGCTLLVFVVNGARWNQVLDVTTGEPIMLSSERTNGFLDLVLQGQSVWKSNGKMYEFHHHRKQACVIKPQ